MNIFTTMSDNQRNLYIVTEFLGASLYDSHIKGKEEISVQLVQKITKDILKCLLFLKKNGVIHCDLKPENILFRLDPTKGVKIIDFGSATFLDDVDYDYLQTRPYRAPEVSLGCKFDFAIDMWSLGCIIFELITKKILFAYTTVQENLVKAMAINKVYNLDIFNDGKSKKKFTLNNQLVCVRNESKNPDNQSLSVIIPKEKYKLGDELSSFCTDRSLIDFIEKCLILDPSRRMSVEMAFEHEFIKKNYN